MDKELPKSELPKPFRKLSLRVSKSHLPGNASYKGSVVWQRTLSIDDIAARVVDKRSEYRKETLITTFNLLKREIGVSMIINPEYAAAQEISRLLRFPSAANIETFCRGRVELMGFRLLETDFMVGKPLRDLSAQVKKLSLLFCGIFLLLIQTAYFAVSFQTFCRCSFMQISLP